MSQKTITTYTCDHCGKEPAVPENIVTVRGLNIARPESDTHIRSLNVSVDMDFCSVKTCFTEWLSARLYPEAKAKAEAEKDAA